VFLEFFDNALKKVPALVARIKTGLSKSGPQDFDWTDFDSLLAGYVQFASQSAALRHTRGALTVGDETLVASGKLTLEKLKLQINQMHNRLELRIKHSEASIAMQRHQASQQQWLSSFAVSALFLIAVAIWLWERRRRIQVHAQIEMSNELLEQRVAQRTQDLAAANARISVYAQESQALVDSERKRLSREVHDQVGQIFTGIKMIVGALENGRLDTAQQTALLYAVDSGVRIARRISAELRPPLLDDFGLPPALEHFLKSVCRPAGLSYDFHFPDECRLGSMQMSELFRMVQEACSNVIQHAQAMHMEVVGRVAGDYMDVCIDDDGVGYEPALVRAGALGILGMRERAHLIGAHIDICASPMGGTRVRISVPLMKPEMAEHV
jgi:signal transduction histidine kinase